MDNKKVISTNDFKIENNIISFNNSLVQISNISHINVEPVPKPKFPHWPIIVGIIGVVGIIEASGEIQLLGFLLVGFVAMYILYYVMNYNDKEDKYLCIYLNSGHTYFIYCENEKFLKKVMGVMEYCINKNGKQKIKVDFNQCTLEGVPINIGNEKKVVNTVTTGNNSKASTNINKKKKINSTVTMNDPEVSFFIEDWSLVQNELRKACKNLPKSSKEYAASKEALKFAINEDEPGLFEVFNKYSESFLSSLFKGVVSGVLVEIIKSMLL